MKKVRFVGFLAIVVLTIVSMVLVSCGSAPSSGNNTHASISNDSDLDTTKYLTSFEGYWVKDNVNNVAGIEEGETIRLNFHSYSYHIIVVKDNRWAGQADRGVIKNTETKLTFINERSSITTNFKMEGGKLSISGSGQAWMDGAWTKVTEPLSDSSEFPVGTWVGISRSGEINIIHFYPDMKNGYFFAFDENNVVSYGVETAWRPNQSIVRLFFDNSFIDDTYIKQGENLLVNNSILYKKLGRW